MWDAGPHYDELIRGMRKISVSVDAWYGGVSTVPDLPVSALTFRSELTDSLAVRSSLSLTIADPDGSLAPRTETDPLAPYGQMLVARAVLSLPSANVVESVPLGTFRIEASDATEQKWFEHRTGTMIPTGGPIRVDALDFLADLSNASWEAPSQPQRSNLGSIAKEVSRLCNGWVPVDTAPLGASTILLPYTYTYPDSRWETLCLISKFAHKVPFPGRDGALTFRPGAVGDDGLPVVGTPVWDVTSTAGTRILANAKLDRRGLYNSVVGSGETDGDDPKPILAVARQKTGPLRAGGPFKIQSKRIDVKNGITYAHVSAAVEAELRSIIERRAIPVNFTCTPNPALDVLDTVTIELEPGKTVSAVVQSLEWDPLSGGPMTGTAAIRRGQL